MGSVSLVATSLCSTKRGCRTAKVWKDFQLAYDLVGHKQSVWAVLIVLTTWAFWRGDIFLATEEDILKDTVVGEEKEKDMISQYEDTEHGHHTPEPSYPQPLRSTFSYV